MAVTSSKYLIYYYKTGKVMTFYKSTGIVIATILLSVCSGVTAQHKMKVPATNMPALTGLFFSEA